MPTNYPTSVDVLTNPAAGDKLNAPSHADQHITSNDAIEAIETRLGTGADTTPGAASRVLRSTSATASQWAPLALGTDVTGSLSIEKVSGFGTYPIPVAATALGTYTAPTIYTITWTSLGAGFVQGSSTASGIYTQIGKLVTFQGVANINTGGGWNPGAAGEWHFSLPVAVNSSYYAMGSGYILDSGNAYITGFTPTAPAGNSYVSFNYNGQPGQGYGGVANPIAWATGDLIWWTITYIAA